jgi:hypothetical protein
MTDRTRYIPRAHSGRRRGALLVGQTVEVTRGLLAGASGVLTRITADRRCLVELHCQPRGVLILIDPAAVAQRPAEHAATAAQGVAVQS